MSWLKDPVVIMKEIMPWLFKDTINSAWLNLTMANQTVKNGLKDKKINLPQFFILQNFKKIIRADLELLGCAIFGPRMAHFPEQNFFSKNQFVTFIYLLALFIVQG